MNDELTRRELILIGLALGMPVLAYLVARLAFDLDEQASTAIASGAFLPFALAFLISLRDALWSPRHKRR